MEKKLNVSVSDGEEFFAHEASINFNPMQFIVDFRCVTPRVDPRSSDTPTIAIKHNVIMLDPFHTTQFYNLLGNVIQKYEQEFGKIEKPKAVKKFEEKHKKMIEGEKKELHTPSYLG